MKKKLKVFYTVLRDKNEAILVKNIISAQMSRQKRLSKADIVLDNSGTLEALQKKIDSLHQTLTALAKKKRRRDNSC